MVLPAFNLLSSDCLIYIYRSMIIWLRVLPVIKQERAFMTSGENPKNTALQKLRSST